MSIPFAINVKHLCKEYDIHKHAGVGEKSFKVLDDISFQLNKGESLAIVGRNGSGKSTLLSVLSSITSPSSGSVQINGRIVSLLELGAGFHNDLTGRENLRVYAAMLGLSRREIAERYSSMVAFGDMAEFMEMKVRQYSSGMKVRLAMGIALHTNPDILIADEVFSVLDMSFVSKCMNELKKLKDSVSLILVDHRADRLRDLCERGLWLEQGKVKEIGELANVIECFESYYK